MSLHRQILRRRIVRATVATVVAAIAIAMPASAAPPIDTTSTTGIHIETVPITGTSDQVVGGSDDTWVALEESVWRGTGYPEAVVPPSGAPSVSVLAISDNGIVAGNHGSFGTRQTGFVLRPDGTFVTLPSPAGDSGVLDVTPVAVADDGTVVGTYHAVADTCRSIAAVCGFRATPNADGESYSVETFTTPENQPFRPTAIGGTGNGIVVASGGRTWTEAGGYQDLQGVAADRGGVARAISASGALVGTVSPEDGIVQPAYWASPSATPVVIPMLGGDLNGSGEDLNELGQVAGWSGASSSASGVRRAFVWDAVNGTTDLGTLPGGTSAEAVAITEDGRVVGQSDNRPVLWDLDGDVDLNHPPVVDLVAFPPSTIEAGDLFVLELSITDPEGDPYELVMDGLPGGSFDVTTDTFRWDTSAGDDGDYTYTFTVREVDDPTNAYVFPFRPTLTVEPGTVIDPVEISIDEQVTVSDDLVLRPSVGIVIGEVVSITDDVGFDVPPPPVVISIAETVTVADEAAVTPSVRLNIDETITVTEAVQARPSVLLALSEAVTVVDALALSPSVRIQVGEPIQVSDDVAVDVDPDTDGDGIADAIDGRKVGITFASDAETVSDHFSDRHRSGTTHGSILDRGTLVPTVVDVGGDGVRLTTAAGASGARSDFDLCGLPGRVRVLPKSSVVVRCGSLFATVEAGGIEVELSDGAVLAVDAPGSVVVRDDGAAIEIEVFAGPARLVDGAAITDLVAGDVVTRPEGSSDDGPLSAPGSSSPSQAPPAAPVTSGGLAYTGSLTVDAMLPAALALIVLGAGMAYAASRRPA
ncbi:MAG: hypothetical protein OSA99_10195 [Acidimicrobiales bacterium]|nr:hypothetical protein [Acidimicrobiales bacterium]